MNKVKIKGDVVHPMDRAGFYAQDLMTIVHSYDPDVVVLEGYGFSRVQGVDTIVLQCAIGTILRYFLRTTLDTPYFEIPPTSLKKFITGKGNAKKDTIMMEVYKRWGYEAPDNDLADAYGLAMAAGCLFGYVGMPKINTDALDKLHDMDLYKECASTLCV
ncbi:MAG: hypothetical protein OEX12_11285 [Gammaproteobacteria bacterium]|nr:hypothetical protein [Gammaproteobacteria bacterium]